jgi:hypothetical protein
MWTAEKKSGVIARSGLHWVSSAKVPGCLVTGDPEESLAFEILKAMGSPRENSHRELTQAPSMPLGRTVHGGQRPALTSQFGPFLTFKLFRHSQKILRDALDLVIICLLTSL